MSKDISTTNIYQSIKSIIENARKKVKYTANWEMIIAYWEIGRHILVEEQKGKTRADYGKYLLKNLSFQLKKDFGKGFDRSNLRNMRHFYLTFQKRDALRPELTWTHYRLLMRIDKEDARQFYLSETIKNSWSTRILKRQINSLYFERLLLSTDKGKMKSLVEQEKNAQPQSIIKSPYVLEFLGLKPQSIFTEEQLETALINKLQFFLLELGRGFSFVARQQRISTETKSFFIDLVFYN